MLGDGILYFTLEERLGANPQSFRKKEKGRPRGRPIKKSIKPAAYGLGRLRLLGALLLDFLNFIHEVVGLFQQRFAFFLAVHHVGLAAIEKV